MLSVVHLIAWKMRGTGAGACRSHVPGTRVFAGSCGTGATVRGNAHSADSGTACAASLGDQRAPLKIRGLGPWALGAVVLSSFLARGATYWRPGSWDLRLFAYFGARWRDGAVPYRDIWDSKPPGIFAIMAMSGASRAYRIPGLLLFETVFLVAAVLLLYALLRRLHVERAWAGFAAACLILLSALSQYDGGGVTEFFLIAPEIASIYCWTRVSEKRGWSWGFLAGASGALGALFKLPGIAPVLAISVVTTLEVVVRARPLRACLREWLLVLAGLVVPWAIVAAYFAHHGVATEFFYASVLHPFLYGATNLSGAGGLLHMGRTVHDLILPMLPLLFVGAAGAVAEFARVLPRAERARGSSNTGSIPPRHVLLVCLWVAADLGGAIAGGRFYSHYFQAVQGSACVALGLGLHVLFRASASRGARVGVMVAIGGPLLMASTSDVAWAFAHRNDPLNNEDQGAWALAQVRTAAYLRSQAGNGDTVFVWNYSPLIYQSSALRNAFPLTTNVNLIDSPTFARRSFAKMMGRWAENPPSWVVLSRTRSDPRIGDYERQVNEVVAARYDLAHEEYPYAVYRLRRQEQE